MTGIWLPDNTRETFAYDAVRNRVTRIDGNNALVTYLYDAAGRNTGVDYPTGVATQFSYDALGARVAMTDGVGVTTWTYDALGRLTGIEDPYGNAVTYSYDVRDRKQTMVVSGVGVTTYGYDSQGRLGTIRNPYGELTTYSYDALDRTSRQDNANGTYSAYDYDAAGRLTAAANKKSDGSAISIFTYTYDAAGNRTGVSEADGDLVTWSYDSVYRLTQEQRNGGNAYNIGYTYDGVGNRVTKTSGGVATTYTYDAGDKMLRFEDNTGITTLTYDLNGNQVTKTTPAMAITTYSYNYENKMTGVILSNSSLNTLVYDGEGKRLEKRDSAGTLRFVYDEQGPTGLYDLVAERDGAGSLQAFYTQGPSLLAMRRGANSYFYHGDALSSTTETTDPSETVATTQRYYAFGEILASTGVLTNPFKYVGGLGYYTDPDSDLLLLRARYYGPMVGRFTTRDDLLDLDGYTYCSARPTSLIDPSGLFDVEKLEHEKDGQVMLTLVATARPHVDWIGFRHVPGGTNLQSVANWVYGKAQQVTDGHKEPECSLVINGTFFWEGKPIGEVVTRFSSDHRFAWGEWDWQALVENRVDTESVLARFFIASQEEHRNHRQWEIGVRRWKGQGNLPDYKLLLSGLGPLLYQGERAHFLPDPHDSNRTLVKIPAWYEHSFGIGGPGRTARRTAMGVKADGTTVLFATERPITSADLQVYMIGRGCESALFLDGGKSTGAAINNVVKITPIGDISPSYVGVIGPPGKGMPDP